jgi:hypothetical protein
MAILALAGCNPELDAYHRIELGKRLPANDFLKAKAPAEEGGFARQGYSTYFTWPAPIIGASKCFAVLLDSNGLVAAKAYYEIGASHWLLLQTGTDRIMLEVQVPSERFAETPSDWHPMLMWAKDPNSTRNCALGYIAWIDELLSPHRWKDPNGPQVSGFTGIYKLDFLAASGATWWGMKEDQPQDFRGVTQPGFDRTIDLRNGGRARIQNLGDRRIRVEFTFFRIVDPFFLTLFLGRDEPPIVTDKARPPR